MKNMCTRIVILLFLTGCAESMALLGPATTVAGKGNVLQSSFSTAASYGIKKQTGKSPLEHMVTYVEKNNPENKKEKCVSFLEASNSEICSAIKSSLVDIKKNIETNSKIKRLDQ